MRIHLVQALVVGATALLLRCSGGSGDDASTGAEADASGASDARVTGTPGDAGKDASETSRDASSANDATTTTTSVDSGSDASTTRPAGDAGGTGTADTGAVDAARDSSSSGDAGAPGAFAPCPTDGSSCAILPLGDSITYGIQYPGAYRVELFHDALTDKKKITFVGDTSLDDGPATVDGVAFPQANQGHSGWTIKQVTGLIPSPALDQKPQIILLHIGTNDIYTTTDPASQAPQRLGTLIDDIVTAAPNALLVVAQITPLQNATWAQTVVTYNAAIPAVVQARASAGKHVILVDQHTGFDVPTMLSSDGIHPNQTGYNHMGDVWYAAIKSMLP